MFTVICPHCGARQQVPDDAIGSDRTDPWNVIGCLDCGVTFDFDNEDLLECNDETGADIPPDSQPSA